MNIPIAAGYRRVFFLNYTADPYYYSSLVWVEGVGNLASPLYGDLGDLTCGTIYCTMLDSVTHLVPYYQGIFVSCFSHQHNVYFDACAYNNALDLEVAHPDNVQIIDSCSYFAAFSGINHLAILSNFDLQPNPTSNGLTTVHMDIAYATDLDIVVWDMQGRQVATPYHLGKMIEGTHQKQLDLSALSNGIYLVECRSKEGSLYRKLVIQK
jgi:hypothetical protein